MQINPVFPPRSFVVGINQEIVLYHVANCKLGINEMITFLGPQNEEYDLVAKEWGFYATPSINSRMAKFGIMTALVEGPDKKKFVHLIYSEKLSEYEVYCQQQDIRILTWLFTNKTT